MSCGGASDVKKADKEVQHICDSVKSQVEAKTGKKYKTFHAQSYKTQVVAGTNYFVKVHVGGDEYIHIRVFKGLPHTNTAPQVHSFQAPKTQHDPIEYF